MAKELPNPDFLRSCFDYDELYGDLIWRTRPRYHFPTDGSHGAWNAKYPGRRAGTALDTGYLAVQISGAPYLVHRIVWHMHYGDTPDELDHINNDPCDNRIFNLRPATRSQNRRNQKRKRKNSTSQYLGVSRQDGGWVAKKSQKYLGFFSSEVDAALAFDREVRRVGDSYQCLNFPDPLKDHGVPPMPPR